MPMSDLTKIAMSRLIQSEPWRQYVRLLIEEFESYERAYDRKADPELMGIKQALRVVIERPYTVAEVASPLARAYSDDLAPTRRRRTAKPKDAPPRPIPVPLRQSNLV